MKVHLTVNDVPREIEAAPNAVLADILRGPLGLTGTHVGCDTAQCGACTVHLDGRAVKSCAVLAGQLEGTSVVTIEGLGAPGNLHPMQTAFQDRHGLQCGFCTPGMIMMAVDLVRTANNLDEGAVREGLSGNYCRCTGYHNIVAAVLDVAQLEVRP